MRRRTFLPFLALLLAAPALAQAPLLDLPQAPGLREADRANVARFLRMNLPRALAFGPDGAFGWHAGGPPEELEAKALESCRRRSGGAPCWIQARDLAVVAPGEAWAAAEPPSGARFTSWGHETLPDPRFLWWGPDRARGVLVWAHGRNARGADARGGQPQSWTRRFNNAGFDVWRFDRHPATDETRRAAEWLRADLAELRRRGYRQVVAAGQSRGGWNALMAMATPGLVDAAIAIAPAAHGEAGSPNHARQLDDLREVLGAARGAASIRLAVASFRDDPFDAAPDGRADLLREFAPRAAAFLAIDRPEGLAGHAAGATVAFNDRFGLCLYRFATAPDPPRAC
ncbi:hypothetical protein [Falsiroseomonas sp. CW058]|uniref:hypothetical protein n=1 Tax=Falsiroseomonas sp. CW058 TaxID=3388664 RepID=UPI003D31ADA8